MEDQFYKFWDEFAYDHVFDKEIKCERLKLECKGPFTPSVSINDATILDDASYCSHWKQWMLGKEQIWNIVIYLEQQR